MKKNQIAAQLFTLREYFNSPEETKDTLKKVREAGYTAVQVSGIKNMDPVLIHETATRLGLTICATHTAFDRMQNDFDAVVKEHHLWNCEYIGIGSMPAEYSKTREGYTRFAKEASQVGAELRKNGLKLIYHNHAMEFEKFDGYTAMEILLEESQPENLGFEIDTYWVQAGGANPVRWIEKVAGRMDVVHFKDMAVADRKPVMAAIGEGNLDWPEIIEACRKIGVKWYAIEQDVCPRNPFDCLAASYQYLSNFT